MTSSPGLHGRNRLRPVPGRGVLQTPTDDSEQNNTAPFGGPVIRRACERGMLSGEKL